MYNVEWFDDRGSLTLRLCQHRKMSLRLKIKHFTLNIDLNLCFSVALCLSCCIKGF